MPVSSRRPVKMKAAKTQNPQVKQKPAKGGKPKAIIALLIVIIALSTVLLTGFSTQNSKMLPVSIDKVSTEQKQAIVNELEQEPLAKGLSYHLNVSTIKPFMETYCYKCHNGTKQKGDVRLDDLPIELVSDADAQLWQDALVLLW